METSKKLVAYKINDSIVGIDLPSWTNDDLNGNDAFKIIESGDTIPTGYEEISSIVNWYTFGREIANDYLVTKFQIREIINLTGWTGMTNTEKDLAIEYYAYPNATDAAIHLIMTKGFTSQQANGYILQKWHLHHGRLLTACRRRWYYVKFIVPQFLNFSDAEDLFDTAQNLIFEYTEMGRLGIDYDDNNDGIMDYLMSTNGFIGQGMEENNYNLISGDWATFKQQMKNVLVLGIYNKYDDPEIDM